MEELYTFMQQPTRTEENEKREMMAKFERLNEEYNKMAQINYSGKFCEEDIANKLNLNEQNVFFMIGKAKQDIKNIRNKNKKLNEQITEYERYQKRASDLIESMEKINELYIKLERDLRPKPELVSMNTRLDANEHFVNNAVKNKLIDLKCEIDTLIDKTLEEFTNNNKKISDFSNLVRKCFEPEDVIREKNICNICVTHKINTCLNPCGHTFCLSCANKMNNSCAMCRKSVASKIKMFIIDDDDANEEEAVQINEPIAYDTVSLFSDYLQ